MYTVLRFESPTETVEKLTILGEGLNRIKEKTFSGLDRIGGRFSCSVCDDDNWDEHTRAMSEFLSVFKEILVEAKSYGIEVEFDVALEPEDCEKKSYISTCLEPQLLKKLVDEDVGITLSYYTSQQHRGPGGGQETPLSVS